MTKENACIFILTLLLLTCQSTKSHSSKVRVGLDNISEFHQLFKNKRVGIITNHTAYNSENQYITDIFLGMADVTVTALLGPEHGIRGSAEAGQKVDSENDSLRDIPIYSIYGKTRKPTPEMLSNVDVLVYDIQDIGARYYTYIYTMAYAMEAAAEQGIPFVVLDRPNPITGTMMEGNILEKEFATFVGLFPIPVRHGMTVGELARMFNGEGWLRNGIQADLTVIPLTNWQRKQWYDETGLTFRKPSPNIPDLTSATAYPGTCLLEGTNVSEGRGTTIPFLITGAPWIDGNKLAVRLNSLNLPGVVFHDTVFTPVSIPGASTNPKFRDKKCGGVKFNIINRNQFQPYRSGLFIISTLRQLYPDSLTFHIRHFDRLCGTNKIRETILTNGNIDSLIASWQGPLEQFKEMRRKYLLYR